MKITSVLKNKQSWTLVKENGMTSVQAEMCSEDDVTRQHRIVDASMPEENARACIYDRAEVIS